MPVGQNTAVIPGPATSVLSSSFRGAPLGASPESITTKSGLGHDGAPVMFNINISGYGFRARCFASPRNDGGGFPEMTAFRILATACVRVLSSTCSLLRSEGAGKAGRRMHPQPRVRAMEAHECSHHRFTANVPAFPARWFTAYSALSPVNGLVCHRRSVDCSAPLDASVGAPGPHGFAVRAGLVRRSIPTASIASRANVS